uniref:histidine kinase n=1 Tax=Magnetococcus massalia (strain MO-1) TaxID=451514 RepID=A0A1S7LM73_MAGMO|nr:Protein of unknown function. Putative Histidine kinase [Candidatus Magnetococcus massalia]
MLWHERLRIGQSLIDDQHRALILRISSLLALPHISDEAFNGLVEHLQTYVQQHFDDEEQLMEEVGYPLLEMHRKIHQTFRQQWVEQVAALGQGEVTIAQRNTLLQEVGHWIVTHIMAEDQKIGDFLRQQKIIDGQSMQSPDAQDASLNLLDYFLSEVQFQQEQLRAVVDALPYALFAVESQSGQVIIANTQAQQLGLQQGELLTLSPHAPVTERLPLDQTFSLPVAEAIAEQDAIRQEYMVTHQGAPACYLYRAVPIRDHGGSLFQVVVTAVDTTAIKRDEERLRYAAFQSGVAEMSISILHNIGNAIMSIMNRAEQMEEKSQELTNIANLLKRVGPASRKRLADGQSAEAVLEALLPALEEMGGQLDQMAQEHCRQHARKIRTGVAHISEIIKIHQDSAQQVMVSQFNLVELLDDAIVIQSDLLDKYGVEVELELSAELSELSLPRSQMLQTMINLIKNSLEAIAQQMQQQPGHVGHILISAAPLEVDQVQIQVSDNGCGIEPEKLEQIFRFGVTSKKRGTGFGLHASANFVQSVGGKMGAFSEGVGQGTTLTIQLPVRSEQEAL